MKCALPPHHNKQKLTESQILSMIANGELFGMGLCDVECPPDKHEFFDEFPAVFKRASISLDTFANPEYRALLKEKKYLNQPRTLLVNSHYGTNLLMISEQIQWYLLNGIKVTLKDYFIAFCKRKVFAEFGKLVMSQRKACEQTQGREAFGKYYKLIGNSGMFSLFFRGRLSAREYIYGR